MYDLKDDQNLCVDKGKAQKNCLQRACSELQQLRKLFFSAHFKGARIKIVVIWKMSPVKKPPPPMTKIWKMKYPKPTTTKNAMI